MHLLSTCKIVFDFFYDDNSACSSCILVFADSKNSLVLMRVVDYVIKHTECF